MATIEKVRELILKLKKKDISAADLKPEARLVDDLSLDSLDQAELLVLAEDAFSMKVPLEDLEKLTTVGAIAKYFEKPIPKRA